VPKEDWDPIERFRLPQELRDDFARAAAAEGRTKSEILRTYVRRYVAAWKGRQARGDHDAASE
jgi:predicted DNA-binding protein